MIDVLIGTNNQGKYSDALRVAEDFPDFVLHRPQDLNITTDPEETGSTYIENAHIKRDFYVSELIRLGLRDYFVVCDDGGIEINALGGEPGIHSRRWKDGHTAMSDQEIVEYALERLKDVPEDKRTAGFAGIIALGHPSKAIALDVPYRLDGIILTQPDDSQREEGYPFRTLFYLPRYQMMLSHISHMPLDERPKGFMSHRELGLRAAFDKITELTA